jgi:hypothetical protein
LPAVSASEGSNEDITTVGENFLISGNLEVTAYPNPSSSWFNLKINPANQEEIHVRVFDLLGQVMLVTKGTTEEIQKIGDRLLKGTYLMEVQQGTEKVVLRLIKL